MMQKENNKNKNNRLIGISPWSYCSIQIYYYIFGNKKCKKENIANP